MTLTTKLEPLNTSFSLGNALRFIEGPNGFVLAALTSEKASATVALHGGHVLSFVPKGQPPVIWMSDEAQYREGKAIRGGIPVCWPWFGPHPDDPEKQAHGFARNLEWTVFSARMINNESPQLHLTLRDDALTRSIWDHAFHLEMIITLTDELKVELQIKNTGDTAFTSGGALHTYLSISQISQISIHGLEGARYIDQLDPSGLKTQEGEIRFTAETDNIYLDTTATCRLVDPGMHREIYVDKLGSRSTVVWNPWINKAARMSDFGDNEYLEMVCIETANAASDTVVIAPGETHRLGTTIRVASL